MTLQGWLQIALFCALVTALVRPVGYWLVRVYSGERTWLSIVLGPIERGLYSLAGIDPRTEQRWQSYGLALLVFNLAGLLLLYALQRLQGLLPFNPQGLAAPSGHLSFNTAAAFVTNTDWQSYGGESTMGYLVQMAGLTVQNFVSAATGMAVAIALIRGFARRSVDGLGNFWADLVRGTLYILLPLSFVCALFFVSQGVPQNLGAYVDATTVEGAKQTIAQGPVASQLAIKMLGTNGGGFFNANSAHPYENPTPLVNMLQMVLIFVIGAGLTNAFGRMVGDERQGWAIFAAMAVLFLVGVGVTYAAEAQANPLLTAVGVDPSGGNMEGKEVRFGPAMSALFAVVTTAASCGAVNAMHDSFMPLGGLVPMVNMMLGEVIIGGVGSGLYGMLLFAVLAVFIAGLMVGRTPEYLGKKIEQREVKLTALAVLAMPLAILGFTALAAVLPAGLAGLQDKGPHGFSEMLYAFTSAAANNGSAFAGLTANAPFYDITLALGMLIGRFGIIVPVLAIAGSLARKKHSAATVGTFPTQGPLFVTLLVGTVLIVGGLTYFPALALGPIAEQLALLAGKTF